MHDLDFVPANSDESPPTKKKSDGICNELPEPSPQSGPPGAVNSNFNNNESRFSSIEGAGRSGHGHRHSRSINGIGERCRSPSSPISLKELEAGARDSWSHDQPAVAGNKNLGTPC